MTPPSTIRNSANSHVYDIRGLIASILLGICREAEIGAISSPFEKGLRRKNSVFSFGEPENEKKNLFLPTDFLQPKRYNFRGDARGLDNRLLRINPTVFSAATVAWAPPGQKDEVEISINAKQTPDMQANF